MNVKFYTNAVIVILLIACTSPIDAQNGFFKPVKTETGSDSRNTNDEYHLSAYSIMKIDEMALRQYLLDAPMEFKGGHNSGLDIDVVLPNLATEVFTLFESPVLSEEIGKQHPEIKSYAGKGRTHKSYQIRINLTSEGFNAIITGVNGDVVLYEKLPMSGKDRLYICYFSKDAIPYNGLKNKDNRCGESPHSTGYQRSENNHLEPETQANFTNGSNLKTFRIAVAANGEFTANKGGTQSSAFAALTNYVNNLKAVYRSELSVDFILVSGTNLVYTDSNTDPYTNSDQVMMLTENHNNLNIVIGNANYDIGHVLGYAGGSGGGIASSPSICDNTIKGEGVSGVGDGSYPAVFDFQLIAHEVGHQFGMSHSYNSNVPVCTTREFPTSVEPGAGTTIMSYGYTCTNTDPGSGLVGNDDYEYPLYSPFLNFHVVNIQQALAAISNVSCYTTTAVTNNLPTITTLPTSHTIPKSTPFALQGIATDADSGDDLSYAWEGTNISDEPNNNNLTANTISSTTNPPFFRSYPPVLTSAGSNPGLRYYPRLDAILSGSNYAKGDKLPSIGISTTHTLTVRDNFGGVTTGDVTIVVDGNSGPFLITNDPSGSYPGNSTINVTWSVNNTDLAPVNCTAVDIFLSTDGGFTFPTTLGFAKPNNGSASVTLPNIVTSQARIKVAPSTSTALTSNNEIDTRSVLANTPNIFFDISNQNFAISAPLPVVWNSFDAIVQDKNDVMLMWVISEEVYTAGYQIQFSRDAQSFTDLSYVKGSQFSSNLKKYHYLVNDLSSGIYYFRLKQIDVDGKVNYSKVVEAEIQDNHLPIIVYPNPTTGDVKLYVGKYLNKSFSIKVIDQLGNIVMNIPTQTQSSIMDLNTSELKDGVYYIFLQASDIFEVLKLIKS